jgi:hypothetical protein
MGRIGRIAPRHSEPIEIKMGREIVYREGYADKDPVNKLNLNTLKLLQAALDAPQQPGAAATTGVKGTINIKAGDELVYRMSKGAVETNRLQTETEGQAEVFSSRKSSSRLPNSSLFLSKSRLLMAKNRLPPETSAPAEKRSCFRRRTFSAIADFKEVESPQTLSTEVSAPTPTPKSPPEIPTRAHRNPCDPLRLSR